MIKKKQAENEENNAQVAELTELLQRTRADFENYRKNMSMQEERKIALAENKLVSKILPVLDDIERATNAMPEKTEATFDKWLEGFSKLSSSLQKSLSGVGIEKIDSSEGMIFNPDEQEAVSFEDEGEGENEVVAEELQSGYKFNGDVVRPAMVKVKKG